MEGIDIVGIKLFNVAINPGHSPYIYIYNVCVCVYLVRLGSVLNYLMQKQWIYQLFEGSMANKIEAFLWKYLGRKL